MVQKNTVHNADYIDVMQEIDSNSVDIVVADPPYNLSSNSAMETKTEDFGGGDWNQVNEKWDDMSWNQYATFTNAWVAEASRILKPSGTVWAFGTYHNTAYENMAINNHGSIINEIIWFKRNAFPNLTQRQFTASHETILWGQLNGDEDSEYKFNYDTVKEKLDCPEDSYTEADKQMRSVWDIPTNKSEVEKNMEHPTQKPLRLYERIIHSSTDEGDTVFIPFSGSGNAALSAKLNNRNYIATELDEEYATKSQEYINSVTEKPDMVKKVHI